MEVGLAELELVQVERVELEDVEHLDDGCPPAWTWPGYLPGVELERVPGRV